MRLLLLAYELDLDSPVVPWQARIAALVADEVDRVDAWADRVGRVPARDNLHPRAFPRPPLGLPRRAGGGFAIGARVAAEARRLQVDACVVHMAHHWAYWAGAFLRPMGIPIVLWYAHGSVSPSLRVAHALASAVVTSTPDGFRLPSRKLHVIGQGIDTETFAIAPVAAASRYEVVYVGRVSARKRIDRLVDVAAALDAIGAPAEVRIRVIGPTLTDDDIAYRASVEASIERRKLGARIAVEDAAGQEDLAAAHATAFAHVNLSETGSMDKTVMEALACGVPTLTSNVAFHELLRDHPELRLASDATAEVIARSLVALHETRGAVNRDHFRSLVEGHHDERTYARRLLAVVDQVARP
ncbi:MAG TPA: glycosyltransferase [Acidimicrobiales bacterium]